MKKKLGKFIDKQRGAMKKREAEAPTSELINSEAASDRITNETIAEHREEILKGARKYIYPLQHSKYRVVLVSGALFILSVVVFFSYCLLGLYKFKQDSGFLYRVTQVLPFPVARTGSTLVSYENYLFEVRHYRHYFEVQRKIDFKSESGKQQLDEYKKEALKKVINDAYIKRLANDSGVSVSDKEVTDRIDMLRAQNRLGSSDKVLEDVLQDNWGWTLSDYKRTLKQQILSEKLLQKLDVEANKKAREALFSIKTGKDFSETAKAFTDDLSTKESGGVISTLIDQNSLDFSAQTTDILKKLQVGQSSEIINYGEGLEIVKKLEEKDGKIKVAHIIFNFKDINSYINDAKDKQKTRQYITL